MIVVSAAGNSPGAEERRNIRVSSRHAGWAILFALFLRNNHRVAEGLGLLYGSPHSMFPAPAPMLWLGGPLAGAPFSQFTRGRHGPAIDLRPLSRE
jgi:hypothetical protein